MKVQYKAVIISPISLLISPLFDAPSIGMPCDIKVIYTPVKSKFS